MGSLLDAFGLPRPEPSQKKTKRGEGEEQKNERRSPDLGLTVTGKPRWTRKDIPRLPKAILKISTPEELDDIFDDDGYLEPLIQSLVESQLTEPPLCFVCRKPASAKCSECKMVRYCSKECQRSHWKTHIPTCLLIRDPLHFSADYASEETQRNPEFAKQMAVGVNMRQHGRRHDTVEELIETWAKACTVGGSFSVVTHVCGAPRT
ncbi:hypothetical protein BDN67DRAFT_965161 [Paxillus ammoniavirescens]|nr:hypothetical protein BDN67DRAFT_965161 [Paxillus ammoniavirescens]